MNFGSHTPRSNTSSRDILDAVAGLAYAVPKDDPFLRRWRPARKISQEIKDARRVHTDFFHAPDCYGTPTNLRESTEHMSPVNAKIFDVFKNVHQKAEVINRNRHGFIVARPHDYSFFRFILKPVIPDDISQSQDWELQPLEKCKSKGMVSTKVRMELLTNPRVSTDHSVVFVRTLSSRQPPEAFLDDQSFAQGHRTKIVAKALTGIQPISLVHAELLIDAAIERKIIANRMKVTETLPNFWRLPIEVRGRIYELAAGAYGDIWPVEIKDYHRSHPSLCFNSLRRRFQQTDHVAYDEYLIFNDGLIMPKDIAAILPSQGAIRRYDEDDATDESEEPVTAEQSACEVFATSALLRLSKPVRAEVVKTLFVQPTFCFSTVPALHMFVSNTLDDALSSLRKMKLKMTLRYLLIVFSLARRGLTFDELDHLDKVLFQNPWYRATHSRGRVDRSKIPRPWNSLFTENDAVFVDRAASMRFTHLTIELELDRSSPFDQTPDNPKDPNYAKLQQIGRLLLVKLVNLTLDSWASKNKSRPRLQICWPKSVEEDKLEALEIMNKVYSTTEVTDD